MQEEILHYIERKMSGDNKEAKEDFYVKEIKVLESKI
jgi:hypothetical protein